MSFDKEEIRQAARLNVRALFEHYGAKTKKSGSQLEASWCPSCGHSNRSRRILFHPIKLAWHCKSCGAKGDIFDAVAHAERIRGDFNAVCARAAGIFGVPPSTASPEERERMRAEWKLQADELARRDAAKQAELRLSEHPRALAYWGRLQADHPAGVAYLAGRGIDARAIGDLRFDQRHEGAPSVPLFASDGRIKNVIHRTPDEKPKGLYGCSTPGTMLHAVTQIAGDAPDVVIAEGFADTLTAELAWPGAVVLGAHGCENIPSIARVASSLVRRQRGRLRIAPHRDWAGYSKAMKAVEEASRAGLSIGRGSIEIVKTGENDLNDAWQRGWRPAV